MGLTTNGYVRRTYDDVLRDKIQRAKELFGEDIDTSDQTPLGKFIRINAYDQALAEEEIEQVYYSRFPNTASGHSLDRLAPFAAITRNPAEAATYKVKLTGTEDYSVPAGFLVSTESGLTFYTTEDIVIGADGTCETVVSCSEAGIVGNVNASAICAITNPDADISAVEGLERLSAGVNEESDAELRTRFRESLAGTGSGNTNAIRSALLRIPAVQFAAVIENETNETDSDGRPPHSFECYVLYDDGAEREIAQTIFEKRPVGIQTWGDVSVAITDLSGNERVVKYTPAPNIQISVDVVARTSASFPEDGVMQIQAALTNYINSLGIGKSLVYSTLFGYIYGVPGVTEVLDLALSTDGFETWSSSNVAVPQYGVAVCANVEVHIE